MACKSKVFSQAGQDHECCCPSTETDPKDSAMLVRRFSPPLMPRIIAFPNFMLQAPSRRNIEAARIPVIDWEFSST